MKAISYLALLRGINVGGKNKLPMKALAQMFADAGCHDVQTMIQSGNVIFTADEEMTALPAVITGRIADAFAIKVPVQLHTAEQVGRVVAENPFLASGVAEDSLHVAFLADAPTPAQIATLDPNRSPPDTFVVGERAIYLHLPNGGGNTKLTNAYFDARLATVSTVRNWRTVTKLLALLNAQPRHLPEGDVS